MPDYDNTNRGVLFANDRKESETHPDLKGKLNVAGVDHWFSGWWKQGKSGEFLSVSLGKPCEEAAKPARTPPVRRGGRPPKQEDLEDAPF